MVSGSDCHGAPVVFKAEERGIEPAALAEEMHCEIVETYKKLGFVYENYTKTSTQNHHRVAQNIFLTMKENGFLKIQESAQYYDTEVERFLPDRYVRGTCPKCSNKEARGDECPECGAYLEPNELLDPYSTLSKTTPVIKKTKHFYIDLPKIQPEIEEWILPASKPWRKWVREFSKGWLRLGLEARPITRDMDYGVKVPVKGWDDKVLYVWTEAVMGYLSAAIEWAEKRGNPSEWEGFWKDESVKHFYFVAGGNVPFHTILWPAELIGYNGKYGSEETFDSREKLPGEELNKPLQLPFGVPSNNYLFYKGKKMSKGDGVGITVGSLIEDYGADALRYFFVKYAPEKQDREFIWADFIEANNSELVANLGNFIYRTLTFTHSRFDGKVPEGKLDMNVQAAIDKAFEVTGRNIEKNEFVRSIEEVLELGHFANKYFNDNEPWVTIKEDQEAAANTLYNCVQLVNALRILLKPYTPFATDRLSTALRIEEFDPSKEVATQGYTESTENFWVFGEIQSGHEFDKPEILFEKFEYTDKFREADEG